jgi:hypothetical protein
MPIQQSAGTPTSISSPLFRMNRHKGEEGYRRFSRQAIPGSAFAAPG